jgi:hypothetical protein
MPPADNGMGGSRVNRKLASMILSLAALGLGGCSTELDIKESLTVAMLGVFDAPADATGNADPRAQTYTLEDVGLVAADGTVTDIYDADPLEVRIVNRPQIIHEAELGDYKDLTYAGIRVQFSAAVVGIGKIEDELPITLADPVIVYAQAFTVEKGIAQRLEVRVQWKNTITRDEAADPPTETMVAPTFATELVDGG